MSKIRLIMLSTLTLLSVGAIASGAASAEEIEGCKKPASQPKCLVKVEGKKLAKGEKEEFTAKAKEAFVFSGKVGGAAVELKASKLKVEKGAALLGGNPAEGQATLVFEEAKVEKPSGCEIEGGKLTTNPLAIWYVWLYFFFPGPVFHGVDAVFLPGKGGSFLTLTFKGTKCALKESKVEVAGTVLATETETEATVHTLTFAKPEEGEEFYAFGQTKPEPARLTIAKEPATLTGAAEVELVSKKKFGTD